MLIYQIIHDSGARYDKTGCDVPLKMHTTRQGGDHGMKERLLLCVIFSWPQSENED